MVWVLEVARYQVVKEAKANGIALKQTYAREAKDLRRRAGCYAHAKQFKRLRKTFKRQQTISVGVQEPIQPFFSSSAVAITATLPSVAIFQANSLRLGLEYD
jgi:IS5 family transposase